MKVLIITGSFPPMRCGVGDYSKCLANALAEKVDIHISILTSINGKGDHESKKIEIFPIMKNWSIINIFKVTRKIISLSPDIVHIQYPTQGYGNGYLPWILPIVLFFTRKHIVQTWHEGYSRRSLLLLFLKSIVPSRLVFVRSNYVINNLHPILRWAVWGKAPVFISNAAPIPSVELPESHRIEKKISLLGKQKRLIVFFGFVHPAKGVELLFEIADPVSDRLLIIGEVPENDKYSEKIKELSSTEPWKDKANILGFIPAHEISILLAIADAVILPFRYGGGEWNTSIHSAVSNRSFVITTSLYKNGYDKALNIYFAEIDNIYEMKKALKNYSGHRRKYNPTIDYNKWSEIADQHSALYKNILKLE